MDENQNREETTRIERHECPVTKHPFWKSLLCGLLIFLGAYCASYVVTDWHMKSLMSHMMRPLPRKMDRMIEKDIRAMDNLWKEDRNFARKAANVIHLEQTKNAYKVIIDLRAFDNNENNVQVSANGNILTINGRSIRKSKNNEQISEFQQNYMFGENVKLKNLTKETEGNYYIITIPIGPDED
ncbi:Hsp20 family protein [bacterium]|nr:Hsp20 family protein [bacterium]